MAVCSSFDTADPTILVDVVLGVTGSTRGGAACHSEDKEIRILGGHSERLQRVKFVCLVVFGKLIAN